MTNCFICDKKIRSIYLQMYTCRCKGVFCDKHKTNHDCSFNYKSMFKRNNILNVQQIESLSKNKLEYI